VSAAANGRAPRAILPGVAAPDSAAPADDVPRWLPSEAARDWASLASAGPPQGPFTRAAVADLPEPVRRWLAHAVDEGTPLARAVRLRMHGEIFLGRWAGFTADQRLSVDGGFVWAATARPFGLPIRGFDRWTHGTGEMRWRLLGLLPVASASGEDVTRSAAGRHAGELPVALPTAALSPEVRWRSLDADRAVATVAGVGGTHEVTVTVAADGALTVLVMRRWGPLGRGSYGELPFGAALHGEVSAGGLRVPRRITAGYHYGTDRWPEGQFIRWTVDDLRPG
jgi:hypothetical protein